MATHGNPAKNALELLFSLVNSEKKEVRVLLVYGLAISILWLAVPIGVQSLVNTVAFGAINQPVIFLVLAVLFGLAAAAFLRTLTTIIVEQLQRRLFAYIALELSYRLPRLTTRERLPYRGNEIANRFFDILTVQKTASSLLLDGFQLFLQLFVGLLLLTFYHPILLAFDIVLILAILFVIFILGRGVINTSIQESHAKHKVAAWLDELVQRPLLFRSEAGRDLALKRTDSLVLKYLDARVSHFRLFLRQVVGSLVLQTLASGILLGIGGYLVVQKQLTLGQLVAAEIVVSAILDSFMKFSKHLESFYDLCASVDKVGTIFKMPLEPQTGIDIEPKEEGLSLEIRNIAYETASGIRILRNISFSLAPGERAVLRGPNGSGKSTIIDMLYGLRVPVEGSVYINGVDIRDLSLNSLRSQVALIRSVEPLPDTILNNITLGRSDVPYERVRAVLEEVGLLSEIESLPDHLQSQIDEQGKPLSSAQLQRLMIARTLAQEPRLLLIDSPLETLDEKWRELIYSAIVSQRRPCTVLWATDDLRIQEICNKSIMISMEDHGTP